MRRTLFLSVLTIFFSISFMCSVGCNQNPTKEQSSVSEKKPKEGYELQERCGKQTREFFTEKYGNGYVRYSSEEFWYRYQDHYNKRLNKCLIIITEIGYHQRSKELLDFNENKELGSVLFLVPNKRIMNSCKVFEKECTSVEEWDSLVKPYMEE